MTKLLLLVLVVSFTGCAHGWGGKSTLRIERPDKSESQYANAASVPTDIDTHDSELKCSTLVEGPTEPGRYQLFCQNGKDGAAALGDCTKGPEEVNLATSYDGHPYFMEMTCK